MGVHGESDEMLLAARDAASFERFYRRHVDELLGFFVRRTRDAELAADLTAETFAAALGARRRYRPEKGAAGAWLYGIALEQLVDAQRRGSVERRAQRRLGMDRIELTDRDRARIDALGEDRRATLWVGLRTARQRTGDRG
jgi:RNA polymerase sigma-70 factor (ECF subfamily)